MDKKKPAMIVSFDEQGRVIEVTDGKGNKLKSEQTDKVSLNGIEIIVPYHFMRIKTGDQVQCALQQPESVRNNKSEIYMGLE